MGLRMLRVEHENKQFCSKGARMPYQQARPQNASRLGKDLETVYWKGPMKEDRSIFAGNPTFEI